MKLLEWRKKMKTRIWIGIMWAVVLTVNYIIGSEKALLFTIGMMLASNIATGRN